MASIENKVKELIEPIIIELGYSLYDVIYEKLDKAVQEVHSGNIEYLKK